jgi:hypothetical protein
MMESFNIMHSIQSPLDKEKMKCVMSLVMIE